MKNRLLLLALPLFMLLSGCVNNNGASQKGMIDDVSAHEEVFGKANRTGGPGNTGAGENRGSMV